MTALIGYTTLIVLVFMLLRGKMSPITVFGTIPVIGALLLMASPAEISEWIGSGLNSVWKTAVLFIFSVEFFGIMSDVGMFDVLVNRLIKMAGKNVILVAVATALVAVVGHLDGATATTVLITIPAMLPLLLVGSLAVPAHLVLHKGDALALDGVGQEIGRAHV